MQEQLVTEQEALFGSRPSPHKSMSAKKGLSVRPNGNTPSRRLSLGGTLLQNSNGDTHRKNGITPVRAVKDKVRPSSAMNYVAFSKEDTITLT